MDNIIIQDWNIKVAYFFASIWPNIRVALTIAGIIGAVSDNSKGMSGVVKREANSKDLYVYKYDQTYFGTEYSILCNLANGVKLINFSQGFEFKDKPKPSENNPQNIEDYINTPKNYFEPFLQKLLDNKKDFLIIQAAGNDGIDAKWGGGFCTIDNPEIRKHIIIVGAIENVVDAQNLHTGYDIAEYSDLGEKVDIVAPGTNIYSTLPDNKYGTKSTFLTWVKQNDGTSFAAPYVTGVAGMLWTVNPKLSAEQVKNIIVDTGDREISYKQMNYKILNAKAAVEQAKDEVYSNSAQGLPSINTYGNSGGNIINGGYAAQQGDWIYYTNYSDKFTLYKIRTDGTGRTKLNSDNSGGLNIIGDWIYYSNGSDSYTLYKIRTDGTGRTKLNSDISGFINVVNDWVYYINSIPESGNGGNLYKIRTDGTERTKPNSDIYWTFNVVGDWVYYTNGSDNNTLYKIRTDGTLRTKLNSDNSDNINVVGDWIYYQNWSDNGYLYKIRTDGTQKSKLNVDVSSNVNVVGDWIYYSNGSDSYTLYKIRTDGTKKTKLTSENACYINVVGDWVYYDNDITDSFYYKIRTDGSERQKVQ